jgi:acyl-CoA reductase-like NAD-dependent aldehyde dehydrogenase
VKHFVEDAFTRGGRAAIGGIPADGQGFFFPPTLIAGATEDMLLVKEEQFGTALPVLKYRSVDEAVTRANALNVGLGGSVWGNDLTQAETIAAQLQCGTAWVNQHGALHPLAPFGGVKQSGLGVEFNVDGLKEYTTVQVLNVAR